MTAERNKVTILELYDAFKDDTIDFGAHVAKFVTEDCRWAASHMPTTTAVEAGVSFVQPGTGPDGVKAYFARWAAEVEVKMFDVENIVAGDEKVYVLTHQKLLYKATGKEVEDYVLHEFTMTDDSKISEHFHWCDTGKHVAAVKA